MDPFLFVFINTISFDFLDCFIHMSVSACSKSVNFVLKNVLKKIMTDFRLVKTFFVYHTEGNCMRKKDIKNLTNISVNQGAVSICSAGGCMCHE